MARSHPRTAGKGAPGWTLIERILDELDLGVIVCAPGSRRVLFANREGIAALKALGATRKTVPPSVQLALGTAVPAPERFTTAVEVLSASGQRFFVRARQVRRTGETLVVVAAAHLRAEDLAARLRERLELTCRQSQCAALVYAGLRNREIAERLAISEGRVEQHLVDVYQVLDVPNRTALAVRLGDIVRDFGDEGLREGAAGTKRHGEQAPVGTLRTSRRRPARRCDPA